MTPAQLAAARRFAPPFIVTGQADRRGAKLHYVNRRAVDYASNAGFGLEDVYPGAGRALRLLAPPEGAPEVDAFARAAGLTPADVYPAFAGESGGTAKRRWGWRWALVGALVGAALVGPVGAAAMGVAGGFVGGVD